MKKGLIYLIFLFIFLKISYHIIFLFFKITIPYAEDFFHTGLYVMLLSIVYVSLKNNKKKDED